MPRERQRSQLRPWQTTDCEAPEGEILRQLFEVALRPQAHCQHTLPPQMPEPTTRGGLYQETRLVAEYVFDGVVHRHVFKACVRCQPCKFCKAKWTGTVLRNADFGKTFEVWILLVNFTAIQKHDDVGVLLKCSRFAQVGKRWALILSTFQTSTQLT